MVDVVVVDKFAIGIDNIGSDAFVMAACIHEAIDMFAAETDSVANNAIEICVCYCCECYS